MPQYKSSNKFKDLEVLRKQLDLIRTRMKNTLKNTTNDLKKTVMYNNDLYKNKKTLKEKYSELLTKFNKLKDQQKNNKNNDYGKIKEENRQLIKQLKISKQLCKKYEQQLKIKDQKLTTQDNTIKNLKQQIKDLNQKLLQQQQKKKPRQIKKTSNKCKYNTRCLTTTKNINNTK